MIQMTIGDVTQMGAFYMSRKVNVLHNMAL